MNIEVFDLVSDGKFDPIQLKFGRGRWHVHEFKAWQLRDMYNLVDRLKAGRESKERFRDHYNDQLLDLLCGGRAISDRELEIEIAGWANVFGLTLRRDEVENWACLPNGAGTIPTE